MRPKLRTRVIVERTPPPRPITVDEYYDMDRTGLLEPDARVELIEGEVVHMPPIGSRHGSTTEFLDHLFDRALADRATVRGQLPVRLDNLSEPVPDVAIVKSRADRYSRSHPTPPDVLLIVEVSHSTLRDDINVKVPLYARHGIPEVWIVDLKNSLLRTYRSPSKGRYRDTTSTATPGKTSIPGVPDVTVDLSELLTDAP
ncbi:MAG TPA: Uma2 family endonuclease [Steroidobacteraceae bacterium]|nr:Uma2 family endonuclease [Steroidobacteraceae bacterium]